MAPGQLVAVAGAFFCPVRGVKTRSGPPNRSGWTQGLRTAIKSPLGLFPTVPPHHGACDSHVGQMPKAAAPTVRHPLPPGNGAKGPERAGEPTTIRRGKEPTLIDAERHALTRRTKKKPDCHPFPPCVPKCPRNKSRPALRAGRCVAGSASGRLLCAAAFNAGLSNKRRERGKDRACTGVAPQPPRSFAPPAKRAPPQYGLDEGVPQRARSLITTAPRTARPLWRDSPEHPKRTKDSALHITTHKVTSLSPLKRTQRHAAIAGRLRLRHPLTLSKPRNRALIRSPIRTALARSRPT